VACRHECSPASAQTLAKNLGYNLTYLTAILSRCPIVSAQQHVLPGALADRIEAARASNNSEPLSTRRALEAAIQVGDRQVDLVDAHLGLFDTKSNGRQVGALADLVAQRQKEGKTVLLAGDFNDNFMLARGGTADASGTRRTVTDTPSEFQARYAQSILGNIVNPRGRCGGEAAARRDELLLGFSAAAGRHRRRHDDPRGGAREAAERSGGEGLAAYLALEHVADGTSHLSANKRFDNIFASKKVRITSSVIDQTTRASDHQPVMAEIRWD
jgi:endonuclease/exonuclease/phosphatase family metal-dependent hydrolase